MHTCIHKQLFPHGEIYMSTYTHTHTLTGYLFNTSYFSRPFPCVHSLNPYKSLIKLSLWLNHDRDEKNTTQKYSIASQVHTANDRRRQDLNSGILAPESWLLIIVFYCYLVYKYSGGRRGLLFPRGWSGRANKETGWVCECMNQPLLPPSKVLWSFLCTPGFHSSLYQPLSTHCMEHRGGALLM